MKKVPIIADLHCGSVYGLTPPKYFSQFHKKIQSESWQAYKHIVDKWFAPDILIVNGDCIEGNQTRQGGAELITSDRNVQVDMAVEAIEAWHAKTIFITYGTAYHVGKEEDFEYSIARMLNKHTPTKIEGRLYINIEGLTFDIRHKIGSSGIPHGRFTALGKEIMWDLLDEANKLGPKVDVVIRSHVHYHTFCGDPEHYAFSTPGLQLKRGRFGSREMTGRIDWGAIRLTINRGEKICEEKIIMKLRANNPKVFKIR
jgi:hypothetical protein